jgi:predicted kinase
MITVLMGAAGAGKSTWTKNNKKENDYIYNIDAIRVNKDMDVNAYTRHMRTKAIMAVEQGYDLVADACHLMKTHRLLWLALADRLGLQTRLLVFDTRRELLLQAQQNREFPVKNSVVIDQYRKLQRSKNEIKREGWGTIEVITR